MQGCGLVSKSETGYQATETGLETALKIAELERNGASGPINGEELLKIRYGWIRISLDRLAQLLLQGFGDRLISVVLYGSVVKDSFQLGRSDVDLLYIIKDDAEGRWEIEQQVFRAFRSTWEYRACEFWLGMKGVRGYPEVTTAPLRKGSAVKFQLVYLDMLSHRGILYDPVGFFETLMKKLQRALEELGTTRVEHADGTYGWFLKPDIVSGELLEIDLG